MLIASLLHRSLALHTDRITSNGFINEPIGYAKLVDHHHRFMFYVNLTEFRISHTLLLNNIVKLDHVEISDKNTQKVMRQLKSSIDTIGKAIEKLNYDRVKRGLVNVFGKIIKFVAGNPDSDDLENINQNIQKLYNNQKTEIERINGITAFANHVTQRMTEDAKILNSNFRTLRDFTLELKNVSDIQAMINYELHQCLLLSHSLSVIERTISLALRDIPNLELVSIGELLDMHRYLKSIYSSDQLLSYQNHPFRLLESAKITVLGIEDTVTFLLKTPILKPFTYNYSQVYPIPNGQNIIIMPPSKFLLQQEDAEFWTNEECPTTNNVTLCSIPPKQDLCTTRNPTACQTVQVNDDYNIVKVLNNKQLLILFGQPTPVTEDCDGLLTRQTLQGCFIADSRCRIIIGNSIYSPNVPSFVIKPPNVTAIILPPTREVKLHLQHLNSPQTLEEEARLVKLSLEPVTFIHYGTTLILVSLLFGLSCLLFNYRKRIQELLCQPRKIIHLQDLEGGPTTENEDVLT